MADPIGISFLPSTQNQAVGPQQGQMEGDLASAFKILSLRLPRVLGAQSIAPSSLLNGQGSGGMMGGFNPYSAVFDALLKAAGLSGGSAGAPGMVAGGMPSAPAPRVGADSSGRIGAPPPPAPPERLQSPAPAPVTSSPSPFGVESDFRSWNRGGRGY